MAKRGRPSKLTSQFIKAAESVLSGNLTAIIYTDRELIDAINDELPESARISQRTFERWKSGYLDEKGREGKAFLSSYKKALREQKGNLFKKLGRAVPGEWQKWAWIIERKFSEWNLKHINEVSGPDNQPLFTGINVTIKSRNDGENT